jgi:hypothetical protein
VVYLNSGDTAPARRLQFEWANPMSCEWGDGVLVALTLTCPPPPLSSLIHPYPSPNAPGKLRTNCMRSRLYQVVDEGVHTMQRLSQKNGIRTSELVNPHALVKLITPSTAHINSWKYLYTLSAYMRMLLQLYFE